MLLVWSRAPLTPPTYPHASYQLSCSFCHPAAPLHPGCSSTQQGNTITACDFRMVQVGRGRPGDAWEAARIVRAGERGRQSSSYIHSSAPRLPTVCPTWTLASVCWPLSVCPSPITQEQHVHCLLEGLVPPFALLVLSECV